MHLPFGPLPNLAEHLKSPNHGQHPECALQRRTMKVNVGAQTNGTKY